MSFVLSQDYFLYRLRGERDDDDRKGKCRSTGFVILMNPFKAKFSNNEPNRVKTFLSMATLFLVLQIKYKTEKNMKYVLHFLLFNIKNMMKFYVTFFGYVVHIRLVIRVYNPLR